MSDDLPATHPGSLSPRDIASHLYRVVRELPRAGLPAVGEVFQAWPWGETFAHLRGLGPVARNAEIADWLSAGLIEEVPA